MRRSERPQPARWYAILFGSDLRKWAILGLLIGIAAGGAAIVFHLAIEWSTRLLLGGIAGVVSPEPRGEGAPTFVPAHSPWLIPVVTTLGGLISGILVYTFAPEAEGHGTDSAIEAFHQRSGIIRRRIPALKLLASAATIGSGGSAGREGPTAQIAAGVSSWLGDALHLSNQDRRIAVAVGVGAGIGSIFKAPLGGAILGAEILYTRDFEPAALVPGFIAAAIGYSMYAGVFGLTPVFGSEPGLSFDNPASLIWYAILGVAAGAVGIVYAWTFYRTRTAFHLLPIPPQLKPALGGLGVGLIGIAFPQVLGVGYGWLQLAIDANVAQLAVGTMLLLVGLKIVTTALSVSSGGSGGVFAPGLFIGGMLGGGIWGLLHGHVPGLPATSAPFVIVAMMALFGGIAKAPMAVILMVTEMTGQFSMIIPAMVAVVIAYLVTGDTRIYEAQVPTRADSPAHRAEFVSPLLRDMTVGSAMLPDFAHADPDESLGTGERRMVDSGLAALPVLENRHLVGIFSATDAVRAHAANISTVRQAMSSPPQVAYPEESLHVAMQRMVRAGISELPVVRREDPTKLVGMLTLRDLASAFDLEINSGPIEAGGAGLWAAENPLRYVPVQLAMRRRFVTIPETLPLIRAANRLAAANEFAAVLVDAQRMMTGIITVQDLLRAELAHGSDHPVGPFASRRLVVATPEQSVAAALAQPGAEGLRQLPVVENAGARLKPVGLLTRSGAAAAYLRVQQRRTVLARRVRTLASQHADRIATFDTPVDGSWVRANRTVSAVQLPADAIVTAVVRRGITIVPRGDLRLEAGDQLRIVAPMERRDAILAGLRSVDPRH